jgi:hypothetical protein
MIEEDKKLNRAIEIMKLLTEGINPFTNEPYEEASLINDSRMVRCLYYVVEILEKYKAGNVTKYVPLKDLPYCFTEEVMRKVKLPSDRIGVSTFAKAVNEVTDPAVCKKLTGMALNNQLKKMGILSDETAANGKRHTATNDLSGQYGMEMITAEFNGSTYEKVVFNEKGKEFLLGHIQEIMDFSTEPSS